MITLANTSIGVFSPILSIVLLFGISFLGERLIKLMNFSEIIFQVSITKFQYPLIGSIFLTFILYPLVIFNFFNNYYLLGFFSLIIFFLGILNIYYFIIKKELFFLSFSKNLNIEKLLIITLLLGYFFLALGPITNADSLDYHMGVPLYIVNSGEYPAFKFWIHFVNSGSGEILNTLGLFVKAEQFPSLIQYAGIISLAGIFLKVIEKKKNYLIYLLLVLSCPVLIFLVSSAKIQLNFVAASTLVFSLVFFGKSNNFKNLNFLFFINIFLMSAVNAKYSFALSSFLIWIYVCYYCYISKAFNKLILSSAIIFCFTLLPRIIWRMHTYEMDIIESLLSPLPLNILGYKQLLSSLTSCGYHGCLPYWLIFPYSLGEMTEALGFGSLAIIFLKFSKNKNLLLPLSLVFIQITLSVFFGQNNARWFLEPMIWIVLLVKYFGTRFDKSIKVYFGVIKLQSIVILSFISYGILFISIGSLSPNLKDKILSQNANGYDLFKWSNSKLKSNDVLISTHRSFSLSDVSTIPGDLFYYIDISDPKAKEHYLEIKKLKPTRILMYDDKKNFLKLKKCLGPLLYYENEIGKYVSRNPFNKREKKYAGFIYQFNYKKLPDCLIN